MSVLRDMAPFCAAHNPADLPSAYPVFGRQLALEDSSITIAPSNLEDTMTEHEDRMYLTSALAGVGLLLLGIAAFILVLWVVTSEQDSKLYEADGVVCASQPLALTCWKRE